MNFMTIAAFIGGLVVLIIGAESLVRGASRIAGWAGISPLVIGLTVVAFGTSAPELAINVQSSLGGRPDIAIGNVVGSNIANILFILGASAAIAPLMVQQQVVRQDVPIMIGTSIAIFLFALDGLISTFEGLVLFSVLLFYIWFLIKQSKKETNESVEEEYEREYAPHEVKSPRNWAINIGLVVIGLAMLVIGADWMVQSAVTVAKWFGISELVIGLTVVAVGTSLPELATSITAAIKGERDIAVGNVVGSNIFNLMSVLGLSAIIVPVGIPVSDAALHFDLPVMVAVALASFPVFLTGGQIFRWEGFIFLAYYIAYTLYLVLNATHHSSLPVFNNMMLWFVIPITVLTLGISLWYEFSLRRAPNNKTSTS